MTLIILMIKCEDEYNGEFDDTAESKDEKDDQSVGNSHLQSCVQWVSAFCKLP